MTIEQLSSLAQIVGAGAVLASLIFVGLQIRQNTHSQRIVAVESLAAAIAAINVPAMQSPALGTALATALKDWSLASHDERVIAHYFLFCFFKLHEQAWYQYRSRVLDDAQWAGWAAARLSRRSFRPILQRRSPRKRLVRWKIYSAEAL